MIPYITDEARNVSSGLRDMLDLFPEQAVLVTVVIQVTPTAKLQTGLGISVGI